MKCPSRHRIVGSSEYTSSLRKHLQSAAHRSGGVILTGESGAGKELSARTIHCSSARERGPFRIVDCARFFPEDLTSILFGSEERPGTALLSRADGGTLYLIHPEEAVLSLQERMRSFIKTGNFCVGRDGPSRNADVRVVAGTEKDLEIHVRGGMFLRGFWELLAGDAIEVPPLRERREDIAAIIEHLLEMPLGERFSDQVLGILERYPWPGNYDELIEEVERLIRTGYMRIEVEHLRRDIVTFEETPVSSDPEIMKVLGEIEQCIQAFHINDGAALDFAPYFWRGGPVPESQQDPHDFDCDPWEKDMAW